MGTKNNNIVSRLVYENAKAAVIAAFAGTPGFDIAAYKLTQSYLRLEQALVTTKAQYTFPVLTNQGTPTNTEQRLNLQDSFVISHVGFFLLAPASATDATKIPQTYPDPLTFATGAAAAGVLYSGYLNISVNNNVLVPAWDLFRHYQTNQTQSSVAAGAPPPNAVLAQIDGGNDSFYAMEPNIIIVGSKNNVITINLPAAVATVDSNSRIVLIFRGILAQNSTVVS